jgi:cobalt-zinc-cadmium efflux system protein
MSGHDHAHDHGAAGTGTLKIALVATAAIAVLEVVGGFASHSRALLSDAAHVTMDVVALAIALAASIQSRRPANESHTYGFARLEILAGLGNSALLLAVTVLIVVEAIKRFLAPELPAGSLMMIVAGIGVVVNLATGALLLRAGSHDLNMRAALMHIGGDALGGIAVVAGGAAIALTGASWIDPALSIAVSAIILAGIIDVARKATHVLLESVPDHMQLSRVREVIAACDGVVTVHDLHVWSIGSGSHALSAHVVLDDRRLSEATAVLNRITSAMHDEFGIDHITVQFECESCEDDDRICCTWTPAAVSREPVSTSGT